ncbi:MAG TPA: LCP family protein [Firmicutes bacterium]|nr:LCP family protein [Bacillota bacterium]
MKEKRTSAPYAHQAAGRRKARRKKGTGKHVLIFFVTLVLCLALFGLLGFFLLRDQLFPAENTSSGPAAAASQTQAPAPFNLLVVQPADGDTAPRFWMIRFQADPASIAVTALPAETMVESGGRRDRLSGFFAYGGMEAVSRAVADLGGVSVDRTAYVTPDQLEGIVNQFGGLIYAVPQDLEQYDAEGNLQVRLPGGRQSLTGDQVRQLFLYSQWDGGREREIAVQQEAVAAFCNQCMTTGSLRQAEDHFLYFVNHSETTLSRADYDTWLPFFQKMAGSSPAGVRQAQGSYGEENGQETFIMSDSQRAEWGRSFGAGA